MARVTVEDCIGEGKTLNRFELVILATQRTKDIHSGAQITVPKDNDKNPVISLREIAAGNIKIDELRTRFINSLSPQNNMNFSESEIEDDIEKVSEEFSSSDIEFGLTEDQMLVEDGSFSFEDENLNDEDTNRY